MKILLALTYYRPHVSGLTIYVERLAEALAAQGHTVTVLTAHHMPSLPFEETVNGVRIVRVPVLMRVSKGVIMPGFPMQALRLLGEHDLISIHLPQFEAGLLAFLARLLGRPVILTYHCDLQLPAGLFNRFIDQIIFLSNYLAGAWVDAIIAYTEDYAHHSRFLSKFPHKRHVIPPPVDMLRSDSKATQNFIERYNLAGKRVIGFAARFATEKGVEYLLQAMPSICQELPNVHVLFAGEHKNVIGEEDYRRRLQPLLEKNEAHWTFLGVLSPEEMAVFFTVCDVTVLPSINSTESFGLVQVESMLCGTPVCASDLPGVRVAIRTTGMGEIVPIRDAPALARAIIKILRDPKSYYRPQEEIASHFSTERTCIEYVHLFASLIRQQSHHSTRFDLGKVGLWLSLWSLLAIFKDLLLSLWRTTRLLITKPSEATE